MTEEHLSETRLPKFFSSSFSKQFINDFREKFRKINRENFSFNLLIVMFLLSFGILVRLLLAYHFRLEFYTGDALENIWLRDVEPNPLGYPIVGFNDFSYYYRSWVSAWYNDQWNPYIWVGEEFIRDSPLYLYSYTPFFLYVLALFYRPSFHVLWLAFPLIASDAACASVVYLILRKTVKGTKSISISFFAGMFIALAPINLLYNGVYFLNPGPVSLFTLLAIYFVIDKKWWQCFFWLAIATLTKQNALFLTYPLFMMMLGSKISRKSIKRAFSESIMNALFFVIIFLLGSMPWIIISPKYYIYHLAIPGKYLSLSTIVEDPGARCIPFSVALQSIGIKGWILDIVAFGVNSMFLLIFSATIISILLLWRAYTNKLTKNGVLELITLYLILSHLFLPRGVFKFYTAYFIPFIAAVLINSITKISKNKIILPLSLILISALFFGSNLWLIIIDRVYFPLILFGLCIIIALLGLTRIYIQLNINKRLKKTNYLLY
ncbi:MAG: hypothetical protein FK730_08660 [Asgard group archaeon]|nr:hypothetical protein [Asgard group archaeon]